MGLIEEGLTIEGEPVSTGGDPNTDAGFDVIFQQKLAEPEAAPVEQRNEPSRPEMHTADKIKHDLLSNDVTSTTVKDGLVEAGSERSSKYGLSNEDARRIHREFLESGAGAVDPDAEARQYAVTADQIELNALREEKAIGDFKNWYAMSPEAMDDESVVERLAVIRAGLSDDTYMQLVSEIATGESLPQTDEEIEAMYELDTRVEEHAQLMQAVNEQQEREALTAQQMRQSSEARVRHFSQFATDNRLTPDQAMQRFEAARAQHLAMTGHDLAAIVDPTLFVMELKTADAIVQEARTNAAAREFKQRLLDEPTGIADGIEVLGPLGWMRPNEMVLPPSSVDPERVAQRATTRRETPQDIRRSVIGDSHAAHEYKRVQKIAGELFEKAAPKPQRS
jgi:hypothetical protein